MSYFLKFPIAGNVRIDKDLALKENEIIVQHTTPPLPSSDPIPEKSDHQKVVKHEDERVLAAKRKAQAAKIGTRRLHSEQFRHSSLCFPLTTVIPDNVNVSARDRNQILQDAEHEEKETGNDSNPAANDMNEEEEINSPHSGLSPHSVHSTHSDRSICFEDQHNVRSGDYDLYRSGNDNIQHAATGSTISSSSSGSGRLAFPTRHSAGDGAGMPSYFRESFLGNTSLPALQRSWFELGRGALAQIDILQRRTALSDDHKALQQVNLSCVNKEVALVEKLAAVEREKDDLLDQNKAQGEKIQQLEEALIYKDLYLSEEKISVDNLRGNLECLTTDLAQTEIVRYNYVRHLLPTVVQRLLSSDEYKKDLSNVFNQAIDAGWSEGVQVGRTDEEI
ncbi:hypothetical protein Tco_0651832 [Tanacetum coccineum]|uniref:Uncharacterized protein n=1 Tax=Tanacetum coccineum TaxID=301880 RepID=A0ABQ4WW53_9ASTR